MLPGGGGHALEEVAVGFTGRGGARAAQQESIG